MDLFVFFSMNPSFLYTLAIFRSYNRHILFVHKSNVSSERLHCTKKDAPIIDTTSPRNIDLIASWVTIDTYLYQRRETAIQFHDFNFETNRNVDEYDVEKCRSRKRITKTFSPYCWACISLIPECVIFKDHIFLLCYEMYVIEISHSYWIAISGISLINASTLVS